MHLLCSLKAKIIGILDIDLVLIFKINDVRWPERIFYIAKEACFKFYFGATLPYAGEGIQQ